MYRCGLGWQVLVEFVALNLALLKIHREIQTEPAPQSAETVLFAGQAIPDLDVSKIDGGLMRRLARRRVHQLLIVHGVVLLKLVVLTSTISQQLADNDVQRNAKGFEKTLDNDQRSLQTRINQKP